MILYVKSVIGFLAVWVGYSLQPKHYISCYFNWFKDFFVFVWFTFSRLASFSIVAYPKLRLPLFPRPRCLSILQHYIAGCFSLILTVRVSHTVRFYCSIVVLLFHWFTRSSFTKLLIFTDCLLLRSCTTSTLLCCLLKCRQLGLIYFAFNTVYMC